MNFLDWFYVTVVPLIQNYGIPTSAPFSTGGSTPTGNVCDPNTFEAGCNGFGRQCIGGRVVNFGHGPVAHKVPGQKCPVIGPEPAPPTEQSPQNGDDCDPKTFKSGCNNFGPQCKGGKVFHFGPGPVAHNVPGQTCPVIGPKPTPAANPDQSSQPGDDCDPKTFVAGCNNFGQRCLGGKIVTLGHGPIAHPVPGQKCPVIGPEPAVTTTQKAPQVGDNCDPKTFENGCNGLGLQCIGGKTFENGCNGLGLQCIGGKVRFFGLGPVAHTVPGQKCPVIGPEPAVTTEKSPTDSNPVQDYPDQEPAAPIEEYPTDVNLQQGYQDED